MMPFSIITSKLVYFILIAPLIINLHTQRQVFLGDIAVYPCSPISTAYQHTCG